MKISVCMASYNGAAYIIPQIESILSQLNGSDEVVVVDDASHDNSVELLRRLSESRVRVYRNPRNLGVFASFEKALRLAYGDILFLSDQDDLWLPGKVCKVIDAFSSNPEITLVASDGKIIDDEGLVISDSFFLKRGRFSPGIIHNILKNKYLGCTLAFRRSMLDHFLPIPRDVPMHDMWFGLINAIYGQAFYIHQPLIAYRRHERNFSPSGGTTFKQKVFWRWNLVKHLLPHILHYFLKRRKRIEP